MNIFFGKISKKFDIKQIEEGYYTAERGSTWFGDLKISDYVYIIGNDKIQLWQAREWGKKDEKECLHFDILNKNLGIRVNNFIALNFFKLTTDLIVLTSRSTRSRAFFKLELLKKDLSIDYISNSEIYKNDSIYRKIVVHKNESKIDKFSKDIQLYYDNEELKLYEADFFDNRVIQKFRDNLNLLGNGCSRKDNVIEKLKSKELNPSSEFSNHEISILSLYDTLFCEYEEKDDKKKFNDTISSDSQNNTGETENNFPLNQILYGPPGTGKTYNTILKAAQIITPERKILDYDEALKIFNDNIGSRIEFITFHQNYSYEDFIQGLRPDVENKQLSFYKKDGIFTRIATEALFEYYKVAKKLKAEQKDYTDKKDENEVYLDFVEYLKNLEEKDFDTKNGSKVSITAFKKNNKIEFKHSNRSNTYLVSGSKLLKLFNVFPDIEEIKNVRKDIKAVIGSCNKTVYWVALKEFISFYNEYKKIDEENEDIFEELSYESKKKLLSTFDLNTLREVSINDVPKYVIIIDEINRANISRVFGELITLIEEDKRSHGEIPLSCTLPSGENFIVPSNLHILGTMNTADKSIALLDIALRRRFEFVAMYPDYKLEIKEKKILQDINKKIIEMKGYDFQIGHSYFMYDGFDLVECINKKIIPLLLEYFLNDEKEVKNILSSAGLSVKDNKWPLEIIGKVE